MTCIRFAALAFLAAPALLAGATAHAQGFSGGGLASGGFQPPVKGGGVVHPSGLPPPPPGLPGATRRETVAPSAKATIDMAPNDALFDAINRGDMAAARDALSRGADLSAQNVLGMTPLEESVDLGRNDITFLLLSLRGASPEAHPGPGAAAPAVAANARPGKPGRGVALASAAETPLSATVRAVRPAQRAPVPGLPPASVRYAGSEQGSPVPQAGFLGFGGP